MSYEVTKSRIFQWIGIILIIGVFAGAYWYFQVFAGYKTNVSSTGSLTSGLVGYWTFDGADVSGTTATDRSGSGDNGTLVNGPTVVQGKVGQALNFDGVDDKVTTGSIITNDIFTYSAWIKWATGGLTIIGSSADSAIQFRVNLMKIELLNSGALSVGTSTGTITAGVWTHVAVTNDASGNFTFYINGVNAGGSGTNLLNYGNNPITIGSRNGSAEFFNGAIDEVRIYNRALAATEIQSLYATGQSDEVNTGASQAQGGGRLDSGLAGYWKLDDGAGTSATDSSTNGNTGTLTNGPTWTTGQIGGAVSYDGINDYITTGATIPSKGTVSVWVNPNFSLDPSALYDIFNSGSDGNLLRLRLNTFATFDTFQLTVRGNFGTYIEVQGPTYTSDTQIQGWHHIVATWDTALGANLYVDGALIGSSSTASNNFTTTTLNMGGTLDYWKGSLDEARLYDRVLSADEVSQLSRLNTPSSVDTGLKGYWSFNGKSVSGTTVYDRSGAGNTGTLTNGPTVTPGKIGQALNFDGTNDYVSVASATSIHPALPFSFSFWVKPTTVSSAQGIFGSREAVQHDGYWSSIGSDGSVTINYGDGAGCDPADRRTKTSPASTLVAGQWQHVTGIISGATDMSIYVNGVDVGGTYSGTGGSISYGSLSILRLGSVGGSGGCPAAYFNGSMDEVRLYNRALSTTEIQAQYAAAQSDEVNTGASQAQGGGRLDSGLAGYWKLDDGSGTSATDSSTNGSAGTLTNGPNWTTGQIGGAVDLDGTDDYVDVGLSAISSPNALTLSVWAKFGSNRDAVGHPLFGNVNGQSGSGGQAFYVDNAGTYNIGGFAGVSALSTNTITPSLDTWYHLVDTFDGVTEKIYVNGALIASGAGSTTQASENNVMLGRHVGSSGSTYLDGTVDEARVYKRALSSDEVSQLYRLATPTGTDTDLKGYWSFNGKDVSGTTASDRSGAGNNGTLTNGPAVTPGKIGQALLFDGVDDYVTIGDPASLRFGAESFSVSTWFKTTATSFGYMLGDYAVNPTIIGLGVNNTGHSGKAMFFLRDTAVSQTLDIYSTTNVNDGQWHHAVGVRNSSTNRMKLYVDGVEEASGVYSGAVLFTTNNSWSFGRAGSQPVSGYFSGAVDETRVYKRALTQEEISSLYNAGK